MKNYSELASPLIKFGKIYGKKGSVKPVQWDPESGKAFETLKAALGEGLQVFQIELEKPFILRADVSHYAISAVLEQQRGEEVVPVAFYSRKLKKSKINWTT